jgi:hypothetical protein
LAMILFLSVWGQAPPPPVKVKLPKPPHDGGGIVTGR